MGNDNKDIKKKNYKKYVKLLSISTLSYIIKLLYKGITKHLEFNDLSHLRDYGHSKQLGNQLETIWSQQVAYSKLKSTKPSLFKALFKMFFWSYMVGGVIMFVQIVVLRPYQSVILAYLFGLFAKPDEDNSVEMYIAGGLIVGLSLVICFMTHLVFLRNALIGMKIRIAISSLVYRKMLKLNKESLSQASVGYIVNLLSNDVQRFDTLTVILHYGWISPFQATIVVYYIWQQVGISSLAGVLFVLLLNLPVQGWLSKITTSLRTKMALCTDSRIKLTSEIISGVRVIKMYAWEGSFKKLVDHIREKELGFLSKALYLRGIYLSFMTNIQKITLYFTMLSYILITNDLSAEKVFSTASYFQLIRVSLGVFFPLVIKSITETLVSLRRLEEFLMFEERDLEMKTLDKFSDRDKEIMLKDIGVSYTSGIQFMDNINLHIPAGKLCAIVGPVGSGKSSLLQILLKELIPNRGTLKVEGEISYCPQEPWLFGSSVRNNILFGQEYNKSQYKIITKVCDLEKDFDQLPYRDESMLDESGISLSGGQKARINLARAVYRKADIYLLDDPLSAIDNKVRNHLFRRCILQYLKGKTRVLVTHQMQYLKRADMVVVINEGKIVAQGTFEELSKQNYFESICSDDQEVAEQRHKLQSQISVGSTQGEHGTEEAPVITNSISNSTIEVQNMSSFTEYIKAGGSWCTIFLLGFIFAASQFLFNASDYLLAVWTQEEDEKRLNETEGTDAVENEFLFSFNEYVQNASKWNSSYYTYDHEQNASDFGNAYMMSENISFATTDEHELFNLDSMGIWLSIYSTFIFSGVILTLAGGFLFYKLATNACRNLHNRMFNCLFRAPMKFFESNPSGQILNRFSKDMGAIDEILPVNLVDTIQVVFSVIGTVIMISISNYYMIILMLVAGGTFVKVRNWYTAVAKEAKHLEGLAKSPMFSHLDSSFNGITTIRASNAEKILRREFDSHQDVHSSAWNLVLACSFLFSIWLELICVVFVGCITFAFIIMNDYSPISGSWVGLAISQSLMLIGIMQYAMRNSAETFTQLASVERVLQYTKLEQEPSSETPDDKLLASDEVTPFTEPGFIQLQKCTSDILKITDALINENKDYEKKPSSQWPQRGLIEFRNLTMIIPENDTIVLDDISITIHPGEKVGICGRTGAGKSSLVSALFRLAPYDGQILIDGVDIASLGLKDIRKKISIIPQEPILFSNTLRFNLDPYNEYPDADLWDALEQAELKENISSLDLVISEGGSNFSAGQRQLICLARAILRNNKILVLDEATANVDPSTDALIQETIRHKFKDCTVLTIAHRLNTIMDSDRVIVMDSGTLVECDDPYVLLKNEVGYFYKMVKETGPASMQKLKDIAHEAYVAKINKTV